MHYDPIMCMIVPDKGTKTKDAGGFAPGSKAKIVTENAGSPYESFTVEYGGSPLKRGFKTREAAERYAKKQGLTVDSGKALDKAIRIIDEEYKMKVTTYVINKGQSGQYYGLKNKSDNQVLYSAPNNWKTKAGAKKWAESKGMIFED